MIRIKMKQGRFLFDQGRRSAEVEKGYKVILSRYVFRYVRRIRSGHSPRKGEGKSRDKLMLDIDGNMYPCAEKLSKSPM